MFFKKLSVLCLWSSSFFYCKWWVPDQTQEHHLVLLSLMLISLCAQLPLFSLHWLWQHTTLQSNWAIKPLTSMLCQESNLTQRFFPVWGVLIWTWRITFMPFWYRSLRQRLLWGHYMQRTCPCLTNWCQLTPLEHICPLIFFFWKKNEEPWLSSQRVTHSR